MPHFEWKGPGSMERTDHERARTPQLTEPATPTDEPAEQEKKRLFRCTVEGCGKKMPKAMLIARHFNQDHPEMVEDKDTWRSHKEEIWE